MTIERWTAFVGVLAVVLVMPGPDFAVVVRHAVARPRAGAWAGTGVVAGLAVHTSAAALGLSAVVAAHPPVLAAVRVAGAAYLIWLGACALLAVLRARTPGRARGDEDDAVRSEDAGPPANAGPPAHAGPPDHADRRAFRAGFLTNVLNPKAVLFFLGLLPQFVDPAAGAVPVQTLALALTTIAAAALWFAGIVWLVARSRAVVAGPRTRRRIDAIAGVTFLGLGARLAIG